ncbi:MAG: MFS transporter [Fibrobacterota bacterium]
MRHALIYLFPLAFDIIVSVSLFAGRHSLAERGLDTGTVGSILTMYGIGYIVASLLMGKIIRPAAARFQMIAAVVLTAIVLIAIANSGRVRVIQGFFLVLPLTCSFFFNAYQSFMLGFDSNAGKSLTRTAAHYTGAWSIGFALGPFAASFVKKNLDWPSAYYTAAGIALCIGLAALFFRAPAQTEKPAVPKSLVEAPRKSFAIAAWIGTLTGWTALNMIFIYWPVQAEALGLDVRMKGLVEFCFAIAQALFAFSLAGMPAAYYYSLRLPFAGVFGIVAALFFAFAGGPAGFIIGALIFGLYAAHILNAMIYHSMVEKEKAVRRVAINEVTVGLSFMLASPIANGLHSLFPAFTGSYLAVAGFIAAGVLLQWLVFRGLR